VSIETVSYLAPEFTLILTATLIYLCGAFFPGDDRWPGRRGTTLLALLGLTIAAGALWCQYSTRFWQAEAHAPQAVVALGGTALVGDLLGQYLRWLTLAVGFLFVLQTAKSSPQGCGPEYTGTLLMALAGTMIATTARDLVLLFLGLELLSIPTYVLLYLGRNDAESQEATVKYFFLSILSSAVLLYGFSFLYGVSGSTDLAVVREALSLPLEKLGGGRLLSLVALVLLVAGLGFRITAVPFHFYAPDVYQGTTHANAAVLAVLPKIAGFVALVRIVTVAMPTADAFGWRLALILALMTMTLGNTLALWQDNLRRLFAYSSIAHAGYMLIGLTVGFALLGRKDAAAFDGVGALLFYLVVYAIATAGTFAAFVFLGSPERPINHVDELAGAGRTHPTAALVLAIFMFSLAGIPPLAGFWGKFTLFSGAVESALSIPIESTEPGAAGLRNWLFALVVVGALNAAVAAAYYLRIIATLYFRPVSAPLRGQGGAGAAAAMIIAALLVVAVGLCPSAFITGATAASQSAFAPAAKPAATVAAR
jgi:NADH-quinone oxidoreductase subunit N